MATTEERDIFANEYVQIYTNGSGNIVLLFQNEVEKTLAIGEQMNEINEEAYMNGYNWDAFFNYYLAENAPDILESMESDPEAGSYAAYFEDTAENEQKAKRFADKTKKKYIKFFERKEMKSNGINHLYKWK